MRTAEWIHIVVFLYFVSLAWGRALPARRRIKVTSIGLAGLGATAIAAGVLPGLLPALAVSVIRDWLPAPLMLFVYWQAGEFFEKADERFQARLERLDAEFAAPLLNFLARAGPGRWIAGYVELAYLLCYPMIPMSMGALYVMRLARHADSFWTVVLASAYFCYAALPFVQTLPPRLLEEPWLAPRHPGAVRRFNLWILRNASIHANTFPSAHAASSTAAALVIGAVAPWPVAAVFAAIASGIVVGTFAGRYHYAADAAAGVAVAATAFLAVVSLRGM